MNSSNQQVCQQSLKESIEIKKAGNIAAAASQIKKLLEEFPKFISGWMELGKIYRKMGDRSQALLTFEEAKKLNPNHVGARLEIAIEQFHFKDLQESKENLEVVLAIKPKQITALNKLGEVYRKQKNRQKAMEYFQKALECDSTYLLANLNLAIELGEIGLFAEAEEQLKTALKHHPKHFQILIKLGLIKEKFQQWEEAISYYEQAVDVQPKKLEFSLKIAEILKNINRFDEAITYLIKLLETHPNKYKIMIELGYLEKARGEKEQALKWFNKASETGTNQTQIRDSKLLAIEVLRELNRLEEALETIETILQQWPDNIKVKAIFGSILQKKLDFSAAAKVYQEIILLNVRNLNGHLQLAKSFKEVGKTVEAIAILENAPNIFQDNLRLLLPLGELYRKQQDRVKARECFQKALSVNPTHLGANLNMAKELEFAGLFDQAEQQLQAALKHYPQDLKILLQLGELEQKRHGLENAIAYFQQAKDYHSDSFKPSLKIAQTLMQFNQLERAEIELKQLLEQYPDEYQVIIKLGHLERQRGERESALNWFRKAKEIPSNPAQKKDARLSAMEELLQLGRWDEANQDVESVLQEYPEDVRARMLMGSILQEKPDLDAAADLYEDILRTDSKHLQARLKLAATLSQSGRVKTAMELLKETYQLLGPSLQVLMQLGQLAMALEDWDAAGKWYKEASQKYPFNTKIHVSLGHLMFLTGLIDEGFALLEEAQNRLPHAVEIPLKIAELNMRSGNLELSEECLQQARDRFPHHIPLLLLLSRVYIQLGDYEAALEVLDEIKSDRATWIKQTEQLRGEIAINRYDYEKAESHFRDAIASSQINHNRSRLAFILMITGKIDEALTELQLATEELGLKTSPGKVSVPLISHQAKLINSFRIAPPLLAQLMAAQEKTGQDRLLAFASIIVQEPFYLGAALYLARELRQQLIFSEIGKTLATSKTHLPSIPKRIVQYWDEPEPPQEVEKLSQSWRDLNPEYKYDRFSFDGAMTFLKEHYDHRVLEAFKMCDEPATQADLFRLAYLNKIGGFYADADDCCRKPLDSIIALNPELVVLQEDYAPIGNNFIGCIPGQETIRTAFDQAVTNLLNYSSNGPWFDTGPALLTCQLCNSLLPYLTNTDYRMWPRLLVLSQSEFRSIITQHIQLPYKRTEKSWKYNAYQRRITQA